MLATSSIFYVDQHYDSLTTSIKFGSLAQRLRFFFSSVIEEYSIVHT